MAHYLVTGGCGFIGSHLVHHLLDAGEKVTVLDDCSTGKIENVPPQTRVVVGDAEDSHLVDHLFHGIDGCFHLAAIASVEKSTKEWVDTHRVNLTAAVNVFQAASRRKQAVPVVYASSAAVYGDTAGAPVHEGAATQPLSPYGVDKLGCELHARIADNIFHVPTMGMRFFNVYGPRQDPLSPYSGVISIFLNKILHKQDIAIFGDGQQVRDFVYVQDVVHALIAGMGKIKKTNGGHEVLNVCTGKPTSINQLAECIETIAGIHVNHRYMPAREGDIRVSVGSVEKLQQVLEVVPATPLTIGLKETLGYLAS